MWAQPMQPPMTWAFFDAEVVEHGQLVGVAGVVGEGAHRCEAARGVALVHGDDLEVVGEALDRVDRAAPPELDLAAHATGRDEQQWVPGPEDFVMDGGAVGAGDVRHGAASGKS